METSTTHSTVWARLASVEDAYLKLLAERDTAILERDKARAALIPLLEQVEKLRETVLAQLPKQDKRLPSARVAYQITDELVDRWVEQYERGISLTRIAADSRTHTDTVRKYLQARGIEIRGKRRYGHGQRKETCPGCGDELPAGEEGLCPACQAVDAIIEDRKAAREKAVGGNEHAT